MDEFINQGARKKVRAMCKISKNMNKVTEVTAINANLRLYPILTIVNVIADIIIFSFASDIRNSAYYYWRSDFQSGYTLFMALGWLGVVGTLLNFYNLMAFKRAKDIVKICPNCGGIYLPEDFVCSFCGADVRNPNMNDITNQYPAAHMQPAGGRMCPKCRTINQEDSRFCQACGFDFSTVEIVSDHKKCSVCGSDMPVDSLFCPNCGSQQETD